MTLRQFLDHTDSDKKRYHYQTLVDNVSLLTPEVLGATSQGGCMRHWSRNL